MKFNDELILFNEQTCTIISLIFHSLRYKRLQSNYLVIRVFFLHNIYSLIDQQCIENDIFIFSFYDCRFLLKILLNYI